MEMNTSVVHGGPFTTANNPDHHRALPKKKKRGPIHLIRAALYMLKQNKSKKNNVTADANSGSLWKNLVGSMRPLHAQNHQTRQQQQQLTVTAGFPTSPLAEHMEVFTPPMSPAPRSVSSCGNMSQYASAVNLHELDHDDDDHMDEIQNDQNHDHECGINGDNMIDAKAEEFIAQFYQQIKVQNQVYNHRRHKRVN